MTLTILQEYWWLLISVLGAILVFLLFVQGANAVAHSLGYTEETRRLVYNSTGHKWEFTFTTLVTFGGAFFAAFPLFYSTSFGGAYWLWMIMLFTFVLQAVSYAFQNRVKRPGVFRFFLALNGYIGPMFLGAIVATFFEGANFVVERTNIVDAEAVTPVISRWTNASLGLDLLANPWVLLFSVAVFFLARILGLLYLTNNVASQELRDNSHGRLIAAGIHFVVLFGIYFTHVLMKDGYAYNEAGFVFVQPNKYLTNFTEMWYLAATLAVGVVLVVYGTLRTIFDKTYNTGIWPAGIGTVLTVLPLILCAMWNNTAYFPSTEDLQSSLTMVNSCSSEFTLRTMFYASLLIPFVAAYIIYCWRAIDHKKIDLDDLKDKEAY